ncbi:50S ribosomal protein L18e [Candidatus Woesearchaeota archaeon]|nr:50S ribosomal protein L18e [Candidatus Woesearchaeota archaeon]
METIGPTNIHFKRLINELGKLSKKEQSALWGRVADDLSKSTRRRREVNIYRINKYSKDGDTVIVPGKVLGVGEIGHAVTVAAWNFSEIARKKITKKGKVMPIQELMKKNPKGEGVRLLG